MPKYDKPKRTPEQLANWEHGSLLGACEMIKLSASRIQKSKTASIEAKSTAREITDMAYNLQIELNQFYKKGPSRG